MSHQFLRGKIIRILDDQRLLINLGLDHGVKQGQHFFIYDPGEEITDPETGVSLGTLELVKAEVEVVHVQEKISFVMPLPKASEASKTVLSATLQQITPSGKPGMDSTRERFLVNPAQISSGMRTTPISIGDAVRSAE
ncbi:MAG: FlgT C-terminal domain-containing protein [bacterium]|nr:FlgT C-terminal domain-containing protein [bacterium]